MLESLVFRVATLAAPGELRNFINTCGLQGVSFQANLGLATVRSDNPRAANKFALSESIMAVQQNKKSPSKRGMHRSHNALVTPGTAVEPTTGETHLRHHISATGFYRGRKVLKTKADA